MIPSEEAIMESNVYGLVLAPAWHLRGDRRYLGDFSLWEHTVALILN